MLHKRMKNYISSKLMSDEQQSASSIKKVEVYQEEKEYIQPELFMKNL